MERILLYRSEVFTGLTSVRVALDTNDIPYYIQDEHITTIGYGAATGGIKLFVDKHFFEPAVKALLKHDIISDEQANEALGFGG